MSKKKKTVRLINVRMSQCKMCKLHKSTQHICIMGKGNVMGSIFLIGEAPGSAEAKTGKVFCGRAGKFLDKLLNSLNMIDLVYITNAVHCRPPQNRNPSWSEIQACAYFLEWEISIVEPKVIIPMGKIAMAALEYPNIHAGTKPFVDKKWNMWINPTWHPSYCLRRGKAATNDLTKVLKWSKEMIR